MSGFALNIWSILILLGAVQGLILAIALRGRSRPQANLYLSLFLLVTSLHLIDYALAISGLIVTFPHTFATSYPLLFMMGPFFYLYTRALFQPQFKLKPATLLHFAPAFIVLLAFMPFYILSGAEKLAYLGSIATPGQLNIPLEQFIFMFAHMLQLLIYAFLAFKEISRKQEALLEQFSSAAVVQFGWLKELTKGFIAYAGLYLLMLIVLLNVEIYQVEIDYVILLLTAAAIYLIAYKAIRQPALFDTLQINGKNKRGLTEDVIEQIKQIVAKYYQSKKPYLNDDLKLIDVSEALEIPAHQLSEAINAAFGKNFFDYTNQYRIEEAKSLLENPECADFKIIAIAYDTGFSNKATFNRVFKKSTGLTPSEYKLKHL